MGILSVLIGVVGLIGDAFLFVVEWIEVLAGLGAIRLVIRLVPVVA